MSDSVKMQSSIGTAPKVSTEGGGKTKISKSVLKKRKARQNKKAAKQQRAALLSAMASEADSLKKEPVDDGAMKEDDVSVKVESGVKQEEQSLDETKRNELEAVMERFTRRAVTQYERGLQETETDGSDSMDGEDEYGNGEGKSGSWSKTGDDVELSHKQVKRSCVLTVGMLKQLSSHPDVVELHDVNSSDPLLHVYLKSLHNAVPVPRHWCEKRRYLAGKVGVLKPPFRLPQFIEDTGIRQIREAEQEKEDMKSHAKNAARQRMRPRMGRLDVDFRVLQAAFFKFQTKPKMLEFGDLYYEGKETDSAAGAARRGTPGVLSKKLQRALGLIGPESGDGNDDDEATVPVVPPPWVFAMQKFGPPPAYPHLRVPGVNAPPPNGAQYGFQPGGWGKPPVEEETGRPLFGGDPLGVGSFGGGSRIGAVTAEEIAAMGVHWGEFVQDFSALDEEEEEEEEGEMEGEGGEVEEKDEDEMKDVEQEQQQPKAEDRSSGIQSSGTESSFGVATPAAIDLVKRTAATVEAEQQQQKALFTVLEQQNVANPVSTVSVGSLLGASHTYRMPSSNSGTNRGVDLMKSERSKNVAVTLDPSELEQLDKQTSQKGDAGTAAATLLQQKYEEANHHEDHQSGLPQQSSRAEYMDLLEQHESKESKKSSKKKKPKEHFKF